MESFGCQWLFNDHGQRTLVLDDHCNRAYTRWILREHGIVLTGPEPRSFMPPVPEDALRARIGRPVATLLDDLATWLDIDALAWGQRAVVTACRLLYTIDTAQVASKAGALEWAQRTLDPRDGGRSSARSATTGSSAGIRTSGLVPARGSGSGLRELCRRVGQPPLTVLRPPSPSAASTPLVVAAGAMGGRPRGSER